MSIAALLVITPNRKQPKCPQRGERINKLWYSHTMKYSATKGKLLNHKKKRHGKRFKLLSEKKKIIWKDYTANYSDQDNMVLAQTHKYRLMK